MLLSLLLSAALLAEQPGAVVAKVDGVALTRAEVEARQVAMRSRRMSSGPAEALDSLIAEVLLARQAEREGLQRDPAFRALLDQEVRKAAAAVYEEDLARKATVTEAQLRAAYHSTADSAEVKLLVFGTEAEARAAAGRIAASGAFDAEAASAVSTPGAAPGARRTFLRGELDPAIADDVFAAPLGAVRGPAQLRLGWALYQVASRHAGDEAGFAARRTALEQHLRQKAAGLARMHATAQARLDSKVKLDQAFLASLGNRTDATPAELAHVVATVNGRPLRYGDLHGTIRSMGGHMASPGVKEQVAWAEVDARLLQDLAVAAGLLADPRVASRLPALERQSLAQAYSNALAAAVPPPSKRDVEAFYRENAAGMTQPLEAVRADIAERIAAQRRLERLGRTVEELRARASVWIAPVPPTTGQAGP